jgi:hypothetical protein
MLRRPEGAKIAAITRVTNWQQRVNRPYENEAEEIPALREFKREFCGFGADRANLGYIQRANSKACSKIPGRDGTGILLIGCGNFGRDCGNFPARGTWKIIPHDIEGQHESE